MKNKAKYTYIVLFIGIFVFLFSGCQKKEPVTHLSFGFYDYPIPPRLEDDFNALLKEMKLPYTVEFHGMEPSEEYISEYFGQGKVNRRLYFDNCRDNLKNENVDIVGIPALADFYDYYGTFAKEQLLEPLDDYIASDKKWKEIYPEAYWDILRVDGKIYGLLNHWNAFKKYYVVNTDYLQKYGLELPKEMTMEEMGDWIRIVADGEKKAGNTSFAVGSPGNAFRYAGYESTLCPMVSIDVTGERPIAVNNLDVIPYMEQLALCHELSTYGADQEISRTDYENGSFFVMVVYSYSEEAAIRSAYSSYGVADAVPLAVIASPEGNNPLTRWGYVTALAAKGDPKEAAAGLLREIYSNPKLSDCLAYGTEDYEYLRNLYFGNSLITSKAEADPEKKTEQLTACIENLPTSRVSDFVFDCSLVEEEMEKVFELHEKNYGILHGQGDNFEANLEAFRKQMEEAGIARIIEEMNRQLSELPK